MKCPKAQELLLPSCLCLLLFYSWREFVRYQEWHNKTTNSVRIVDFSAYRTKVEKTEPSSKAAADFVVPGIESAWNDKGAVPPTFRVVEIIEAKDPELQFCSEQPHACEQYKQYKLETKAQAQENTTDVRLHLIFVDALAWLKATHPAQFDKRVRELVTRINVDWTYYTFKGSDNVFICLTEFCQSFGKEFGKVLSGGMGTRAIFAGVHIDVDQLEWPCPLRVIKIKEAALKNSKTAVPAVIQTANMMIDRKNRWLCSDESHPRNHFTLDSQPAVPDGIIIKKFDFSMCMSPKCGTTLTRFLLRRIEGFKNWRSTEGGLPHNDKISGLLLGNAMNETDVKALYDDPDFLQAAIVRHPIPRLLSGYLDKIDNRKHYWRLSGLGEYVKENGHPSFPKFVDLLIATHPNAEGSDEHFRAQTVRCGFDSRRYDFLGRVSSLGPQIKELAESLGFWEEYASNGWGKTHEMEFGEKSYTQHQTDAVASLWEYYDEELMDKVYRYFKADFDAFGFTMDEIMSKKAYRK